MADAGHVAWDMASYQWLLSGQDFPSIHPSLAAPGRCSHAYGLYEVCRAASTRCVLRPRQHQFIKGDTAGSFFDPLTAGDGARRARVINEKLGKRPVVGVVYSHTHVDHWAGARS